MNVAGYYYGETTFIPFSGVSPFDSCRLLFSPTPPTSTWMRLKSDLISFLRLIDLLMTVAAADGLGQADLLCGLQIYYDDNIS